MLSNSSSSIKTYLPFGDGWNPTHKNGDFGDGLLFGLRSHFSLYCVGMIAQ